VCKITQDSFLYKYMTCNFREWPNKFVGSFFWFFFDEAACGNRVTNNCIRHIYLCAHESRLRAIVIRRRGDCKILISFLRSSVAVLRWKTEVYEYFSCIIRRYLTYFNADCGVSEMSKDIISTKIRFDWKWPSCLWNCTRSCRSSHLLFKDIV